ncbi:preprotein translocase subunit SecG [Hymenobacter sp. RP-2-7]|uniref:Protein-export membrane protein SecG n=1 Tax=Hymenobacter polaris TaxID=2682546 RepID=A0A7Y0FKV4_9BACT|nr:preprotein translocase subunit SecG [Hymenobacter polaris]NML64093.1 preprotein translocase subunit SecG [Hymenobacter polaris]
MFTFLIILMLLVSFLLALVVLAQNPKGGGISSQFGAGGAANLMGVKRTGDLLEKLTWGFAIALMVLSLATHMLGQGSSDAVRSINQQRAQQTRSAAPVQAPVTPPAGSAPAPANPAK